MTAQGVRDILRRACDEAGSQRAWAMQARVSPSYVADVLASKREPGGQMLSALGLERVITYRRVRKESGGG